MYSPNHWSRHCAEGTITVSINWADSKSIPELGAKKRLSIADPLTCYSCNMNEGNGRGGTSHAPGRISEFGIRRIPIKQEGEGIAWLSLLA